MYKLIIFLVFLSASVNCYAQPTIESLLQEIAKNNKTLKAHYSYSESLKFGYKTGLNPSNPNIEFNRLIGSGIGGNETELFVTQSFDFPSAYLNKSKLSKNQISQVASLNTSFRQDILLEAQKTIIEYIFYTKREIELKNRVSQMDSLFTYYDKKFQLGDANILDFNKVKLFILNTKSDFMENSSLRNQSIQKLTEYNGGIPLNLNAMKYTEQTGINNFDSLYNQIESKDIVLSLYNQNKVISESELKLRKSLNLPKIEIGYYSKYLLGQNLKGAHLCFSVPLWENANTLNLYSAKIDYEEQKIQSYKTKKYFEIKELYEKFKILNALHTEYFAIINTMKTIELLSKSLSLGHISSVEYFYEISYYYGTRDKYLSIEKDLNLTIAEILKFSL